MSLLFRLLCLWILCQIETIFSSTVIFVSITIIWVLLPCSYRMLAWIFKMNFNSRLNLVHYREFRIFSRCLCFSMIDTTVWKHKSLPLLQIKAPTKVMLLLTLCGTNQVFEHEQSHSIFSARNSVRESKLSNRPLGIVVKSLSLTSM